MAYKLTADGLVTSDPQIAVMFLGEAIEAQTRAFLRRIDLFHADCRRFWVADVQSGQEYTTSEITIPRPLVLKAIEPDGLATLLYNFVDGDNGNPEYFNVYGDDYREADDRVYTLVKANALTVGATVGELRTLLSWADPKNKE